MPLKRKALFDALSSKRSRKSVSIHVTIIRMCTSVDVVLSVIDLIACACVCVLSLICVIISLDTCAKGTLCSSPVATFRNTNVCECADAVAVYSTARLEGWRSKPHLLVDYYLRLSKKTLEIPLQATVSS